MNHVAIWPPRWPKSAQDGPQKASKMAQDASKMAEETTKASQDEAREAKIIEKHVFFTVF